MLGDGQSPCPSLTATHSDVRSPSSAPPRTLRQLHTDVADVLPKRERSVDPDRHMEDPARKKGRLIAVPPDHVDVRFGSEADIRGRCHIKSDWAEFADNRQCRRTGFQRLSLLVDRPKLGQFHLM